MAAAMTAMTYRQDVRELDDAGGVRRSFAFYGETPLEAQVRARAFVAAALASPSMLGDDTTDTTAPTDTSAPTDTTDTTSGDVYNPPPDLPTAGIANAAENVGGDISYTSLTNEVKGLTYDGSLTASDFQAGNYSAALQSGVFDATKIVGTVMNDVGRAQSVIASFNAATSGKDDPDYVGDKKAMLAWGSGLGTVASLIGSPAFGAAITAVWDGLVNAVGVAHAGPGRCGMGTGTPGPDGRSTPGYGPPTTDWSYMKTWPGYVGWDNPGSAGGGHSYDPGPVGSFEAWANAKLEYNRALFDNCFVHYYQPPPLLLAQLVAAWNATHRPTSTQVITRDLWNGQLGANSVPTKPQWDPIADALTQAQPPLQTPPYGWTGGRASFMVNTGALRPLPLDLSKLHLGAGKPPATTTTTTTTAGNVVRVAAVAGVAGAGVWAALGGAAKVAGWYRKLF